MNKDPDARTERIRSHSGKHEWEEGSVAPGDTGNKEREIRKFGMFQGVFVPTVLTILGVILYLRLGWVVGNVGVIGAWAIIIIAFTITTATALSMSSLVSNIRIGPGGAYSIISRSMGLEIGGSIGVPLYLSLAFSVALYIFGFREGMQYIFPDLSPLAIDLAVFAVVFLIIIASTRIAFRIQYAILVIIIVSLVSVFAAGWGSPSSSPRKESRSGSCSRSSFLRQRGSWQGRTCPENSKIPGGQYP
jgi:solute carrier family 12 sodium/potassium/chloride transporter 2